MPHARFLASEAAYETTEFSSSVSMMSRLYPFLSALFLFSGLVQSEVAKVDNSQDTE